MLEVAAQEQHIFMVKQSWPLPCFDYSDKFIWKLRRRYGWSSAHLPTHSYQQSVVVKVKEPESSGETSRWWVSEV